MVKVQAILNMPRYNIAHGLVTAAQNAPNARKITAGLPWREAASVMLVSPTPPAPASAGDNKTESVKPHFLVTQRSKTSGTFSNILCFPGGNVCMADSDKLWIDRFAITTGHNIRDNGCSFISDGGEIPMIYAPPPKGKSDPASPFEDVQYDMKTIPKAISLRVTAIRETFEETGVLLCKPMTRETYHGGLGKDSRDGLGLDANVFPFKDSEELKEWQDKIRKDPNQFMAMCDAYGCFPDVNGLVEWSDWLTPNCFGMQRYDTIFYMALVPQAYPLYTCPQEVESASWMTTDRILKDCDDRKCKMITPQIYELTRLRSASAKKIRQLMRIRLKLGIQRWCSAYIRAKDGYLSVFPGDDLYPANIKIHVFEPIQSVDATLGELRDTTHCHHRIEYRSEFDFRLVIKNYKERAGHIYLD